MIDSINDEPVEFQEYEMAEAMPPAITDWDGLVLERRNDGGQRLADSLCVYRHRHCRHHHLSGEVRRQTDGRHKADG